MRIERTSAWPTKECIEYKEQAFSKKKKEDKYKDPVNDKILKEVSKKIKEFKRKYAGTSFDSVSYRIGCYAGMNIALRNLGREPL